MFAVADTGPLREGDHYQWQFDRSAKFSVSFGDISTCLGMNIPDENVNELKKFLKYFVHPFDSSKGRYVKPESIYRDTKSTEDILDALFDNGYFSPANPHLLQCIIDKFGCQKCKKTLQQYTEKYPCNS